MFIKYPKIYRLGHEDTDGILSGPVYVQEKIDGANASIWVEERGGEQHICGGSRNRFLFSFPLDIDKRPPEHELTGDSFRGFREYVYNHNGITELFLSTIEYPVDLIGVRLYGEWLIPHSIKYDEGNYNQFFLFDIVYGRDEYNGVHIPKDWLPIEDVYKIAKDYFIHTPQLFICNKLVSPEQIEALAGKSDLGEKGEGVVIKSSSFTNKWGRKAHAKVVTDAFKEENAIVFGGNNKFSAQYWEQKVCNKYMSRARVEKIVRKILMELPEDIDVLDKSYTPRVANTAYNDMLTEEIWYIQKEVDTISFKTLQRICIKKAIKLFHDMLDGHNSVAYEEEIEEGDTELGNDIITVVN